MFYALCLQRFKESVVPTVIPALMGFGLKKTLTLASYL
jgi:hypothetical protein